MNTEKGKLYLIPTTLGDNEPLLVLPLSVKKVIEELDYFIVENQKTARKFIKKITPKKSQPSLILKSIDKYADALEVSTYLDVCENGISVGLLSEYAYSVPPTLACQLRISKFNNQPRPSTSGRAVAVCAP